MTNDLRTPTLRTAAPRAEALSYLLFAGTAFGVVLPGTVLPQLLARWALNDRQAGVLLFLSFLSSSVGAVAARGRLARMAPAGCFAIALGLAGMIANTHAGGFLAISLLGFGLGVTMTAVSLMQSRRHAASRSAELSRLNLIWSVGACVAPTILLRGAAHWGLNPVLMAAAGTFLFLALLGWAMLQEVPVPAAEITPAPASSATRLAMGASLALLVVIAMSTGVEASLGGWLTTYSRRSGLMTSGVVDTITCLWVGLLLGRLLQSFRSVAQWGERRILAVVPWLLCAAVGGLLTVHQGWSMSGFALLAGFALGPAYPLSLALWLEQGERGNLAFLIAGCGSSALPLLTGVVSDATHSLTRGLLVPFTGACAMAIMAVAATVALRRTGAKTPQPRL